MVSCGFAAAIRGVELGARVAMVNDGALGGTCVNVGCVPSKTLIRAAEANHRLTFLNDHLTTIDEIEAVTGIDFLVGLRSENPAKEAAVERSVAAEMWARN